MYVENNKKCKKCKYIGYMGSIRCCDYFLMMGERRANPKVEDCVDFEPKGKNRRESITVGLRPSNVHYYNTKYER